MSGLPDSQRRIVARYLGNGQSLTSREAMFHLGIGRLASRIDELRDLGFDILSEWRSADREGKRTARYVAYRAASERAQAALKRYGDGYVVGADLSAPGGGHSVVLVPLAYIAPSGEDHLAGEG